jgi:hypothetical protein
LFNVLKGQLSWDDRLGFHWGGWARVACRTWSRKASK